MATGRAGRCQPAPKEIGALPVSRGFFHLGLTLLLAASVHAGPKTSTNYTVDADISGASGGSTGPTASGYQILGTSGYLSGGSFMGSSLGYRSY